MKNQEGSTLERVLKHTTKLYWKKGGEADLHLPMDINNEANASLSYFSKGHQFLTKKIIKIKTVNPSKF